MNASRKVTECPKRGGEEMGIGKHTSRSVMFPYGKLGVGSDVEYVVCTDCGFIVEGYVTKPNKFKGTRF